MKVRFIGHACFILEEEKGLKILLDPYEPGGFGGMVNYSPLEEKVDIVVISHDHADHCYISKGFGNPKIVKKGGDVAGIKFKSVEVSHDDKMGSLRGMVQTFTFEFEGIKFCHLGDIGAVLKQNQIEDIGDVDILFIPVGGTFTIGPDEAKKIISDISPKVAIPMHYKTEKVGFPLKSLDEFLKKWGEYKRLNSTEANITKKTLPSKTELWVFEFEK